MSMTKAVQRAMVGEGFALGVISCGVLAFQTDKMSFEFAFEHSWRNWDHAGRFPQVKVGIARNDILGIIYALEKQFSGTGLVGWSTTWPFQLRMSEGWSATEVGEQLAISSDVPHLGWQMLARRFLDDAKPQLLQ